MQKQDFRTPEKVAVVLPPDCKGTLDELCQFYGDGTQTSHQGLRDLWPH
jgi:hypothetical protein